MRSKTLRQARSESGMKAKEVAAAAGCDRATLYRIESGESQPSRDLARSLFELYKGDVPLAQIYDPDFHQAIMAAA